MTAGPVRPRRPAGVALLTASCGLLALQAWDLLRWGQAVGGGGTQAERVDRYLQQLPFGMGELGASAVTWVWLLSAAVGLVTALVAGRLLAGPTRTAALVAGGANGILLLWYLFTLM